MQRQYWFWQWQSQSNHQGLSVQPVRHWSNRSLQWLDTAAGRTRGGLETFASAALNPGIFIRTSFVRSGASSFQLPGKRSPRSGVASGIERAGNLRTVVVAVPIAGLAIRVVPTISITH